ncbi:hypothetical protein MAR_034724 [Mya arenaria]|uniref:Uncharacterized protein n=1 Tax=Mya arenaria TaxID=6604 RepID=A0ABY7EI25_MYAAR|nr:hypothetical protein MAR_034724 [Mya arenaria]
MILRLSGSGKWHQAETVRIRLRVSTRECQDSAKVINPRFRIRTLLINDAINFGCSAYELFNLVFQRVPKP